MEDGMWKIFLMVICPSMKHSLNYIITTEALRRIKMMMKRRKKNKWWGWSYLFIVYINITTIRGVFP